MNQNMQKWVEVLESGEYRQGKFRLLQDDENFDDDAPKLYCCLAVACDLYMKETGIGEWEFNASRGCWAFIHPNDGQYVYDLPPSVATWLGLHPSNGNADFNDPRNEDGFCNLTILNDEGNKNFTEIAAVIRSEPDWRNF